MLCYNDYLGIEFCNECYHQKECAKNTLEDIEMCKDNDLCESCHDRKQCKRIEELCRIVLDK